MKVDGLETNHKVICANLGGLWSILTAIILRVEVSLTVSVLKMCVLKAKKYSDRPVYVQKTVHF